MALYENDKASNNEQFGLDATHALRQVLTAMGIYHAPWVISVWKSETREVSVSCYWDPKNTFPKGKNVSLDATNFTQAAELPVDNLCDINFCALARALAKRMGRKVTDMK